MSLAVKMYRTVIARHDNPLDLANPAYELNHSRILTWANGVGADQADKIWHDKRTLAASGTENLDLAGGALLDPLTQAAISFARVKAIVVKAMATNVNNVVFGNSGANAWLGPFGAAAHTLAVPPDGEIWLVAPKQTAWPVTVGTGDILTVTNSAGGTGVDYEIIIIGASA